MTGAKGKRAKFRPDGWELNTGLFEIYWKNNVAIRIAVEGIQFKPCGMNELAPEEIGPLRTRRKGKK